MTRRKSEKYGQAAEGLIACQMAIAGVSLLHSFQIKNKHCKLLPTPLERLIFLI